MIRDVLVLLGSNSPITCQINPIRQAHGLPNWVQTRRDNEVCLKQGQLIQHFLYVKDRIDRLAINQKARQQNTESQNISTSHFISHVILPMSTYTSSSVAHRHRGSFSKPQLGLRNLWSPALS